MDTATSATALLACEATSARQARRFLHAILQRWSCEAASDVVTLLGGELVTNALLHARSDVRLAVHREPTAIRVEVHDTSEQEPVLRHVSERAATGRGLALVEAMAHDWGVSSDDEGKTVWFEVAV